MNTNKFKIVVVGAGLAVVSAAGIGNAFAAPAIHPAPAAAVQSTVDTPTAGDKADAAVETPTAGDTVDAPGGPDVQQGDQSTPDVAGSGDKADSTTEAPSSENAGVSDGPGGYADQGNSNVDTQQVGEH